MRIPMLIVAVLLALLGDIRGARADTVFVSTQPAGNIPGYPSQYLLKTKPGATDVVSVCDSASIPIGRTDMNNCSSARRWVTVSTVKETDKVGYCYGNATTVLDCDIASGGGEGWQLASAIWTFTPQPPVVTGSKKVHLTAVLQNFEDNSAIPAANFAGYRIYFGNTANTLNQMIELRTSQLDLVYDVPLGEGSWFLGATEFLVNGAESKNKSSPLLTAAVSGTPPPPPGCIAPRPTDKVRPGTCLAGTTGAWQQTMAYECVSGAWMESGDWEPVTPPAGACIAVPPPPPTLKTIEAIGYSVYTGNFNKDTFQRVGTFAAPVSCTAAVFTDLQGVSRNIISNRDNLKLDAGATRPKQVWAKCAVQ